jgi:hypothetical protein
VTATRTLELLDVSLTLVGSPAVLDRLADEFVELFALGQSRTGRPAAVTAELAVADDDSPAGIQLALAALTAEIVAHTPRLCIHSGVVRSAGGVVAIPGFSGFGKTTLTAALLQAGFGYLSDEALALDRNSGEAVPFPRPLALAGDVWPLLGLPAESRPAADLEALVPPRSLGSLAAAGQVSDVVLARRRSGAARLQAAPRGDAVVALLTHSFNHYRNPAASFSQVVSVIRATRVWQAGYQDAPELAALLAAQLGTS